MRESKFRKIPFKNYILVALLLVLVVLLLWYFSKWYQVYNDYQKILNTLPVDITYQEVIVNNDIDYDMIQKKV